jgi:hypothetical protein
MTDITLIGQLIRIESYIKPATFEKLEELRGDVSRSTFIKRLIEKQVE